MHILILSTGFPTFQSLEKGDFYGGSFILPEALAYHTAGARVTVLTPHVPGLPEREVIREGLEVVRFCYFLPKKWQKIRIPKHPLYTTELLWFRVFQLPLFILGFFLAIATFIGKVDIIHANWTPTAFLALPFQYLFNVPVILTYRGTDLRLLPEIANRYIVRNVKGVIEIGGGLGRAGRYRKKLPGNYMALPMITRTPECRTSPSIWNSERIAQPQKVVFVFIGRIDEQDIGLLKGVTIIIPAARKLRETYSNFELHVVGDGPSMEILKRQHQDYQVEGYVFLHGYQEAVFEFIDRSNAVIGGLGLNAVVQETAFSGGLLIMPDVPEWAEGVWKDKENALLYKAADPESLAESMAYVIKNPEECERIKESSYKTIRNYVVSINRGGSLYLDAFEKLIEN